MKRCFFKLLIIQIIFLGLNVQADSEIQPIMTNGCTGFVNGNWKHCCDEHDTLYWFGGDFDDRKAADDQLLMCVQAAGGPGYIMYEAVRRLGSNYWGAAWGDQMYNAINQEEAEIIEAEKKVWISFGMPAQFEFINLENIIFHTISKKDVVRLNLVLSDYMSSEEYKSFKSDYIQKSSREPVNFKKWLQKLNKN